MSWFGVLVTAIPEPSWISHAQPEPKRLTPAFLNSSLNESKEPNFSSIASARAPLGSPPPSGLMICQKKL